MATLTLDDVKRAAKREDFRAGVQMRLLTPRLSVHVTRWLITRTRIMPDAITLASLVVGLAAAAAFAAVDARIVAVGLVAFHLHVLLDYVDGEVARCRGAASVRGAYLDLMTDRVTFPLLFFMAGLGAFRATGAAAALVLGFAAAFGQLLDKEACDCWYRATGGGSELEDRYAIAPPRSAGRRWRGRLALLAVMARGLTAFLTYTLVAATLDAAGAAVPGAVASWRLVVLAGFAVSMPAGALARTVWVYQRGTIPRRQQLV